MTLLPSLPVACPKGPQSLPEGGDGRSATSSRRSSADTVVDSFGDLGEVSWPKIPGKAPRLPPCPSLPLPDDLRISCFTDASYRRYLLSSTIKRGSYGKLKYALPIDDIAASFAVKELRLAPCQQRPGKDPYLSRDQRPRTAVTPSANVRMEWRMGQRFGGPFAPRHGVILDKRAYFFCNLAADTLAGVMHTEVAAPRRALLARYVAREVGGKLLTMCQKGALHLDVSPANILMQKHPPYAALADFGTAQAVARAPWPFGEASTYCAPEAILQDADITSQSDLWSLGATLLTVLQPPPTAMLACVLGERDLLDREQTALMLRDFFDARAGTPTKHSRPIIQWLQRCRAVDGPLTTLLLETVQVLQESRSTVAEFLQALQGLPPLPLFPDVDRAMDALAQNMVDTHKSSAAYIAMNGLRMWLHERERPKVRAPLAPQAA